MIVMAALVSMSTRRDLTESPYLAAVAGRKPSRAPVWFMRQAGRSLPEYRALRERHSMLAACFEPEVACEITLQPIRRHDVDAAILFSDIVVPLRAAGVDLDIVADVGPVIADPIRTAADIGALKPLDPQAIQPICHAVSLLVDSLGKVPLIGFAGAPFTLASYLVEGGPSRDHARTKAMMLAEPANWHALMSKLADLTIVFLRGQIDAGVDAIQMFDSWAGTLSLADYRQYVLPDSSRVFATLADGMHAQVEGPLARGARWAVEPVEGDLVRVIVPGILARAWYHARLRRGPDGGVTGLVVNTGRLRDVVYERVPAG